MKTAKFIRSNPHLPVRSLRETLDYYRDQLGFYDEWSWPDKDGNHTDGGIRRDDMRLLFGEDAAFSDLINGYGKSRLSIMWFVENLDEVFAEFQARGVEFYDTLQAHSYGLREFSFVDINGYLIRVASPTP